MPLPKYLDQRAVHGKSTRAAGRGVQREDDEELLRFVALADEHSLTVGYNREKRRMTRACPSRELPGDAGATSGPERKCSVRVGRPDYLTGDRDPAVTGDNWSTRKIYGCRHTVD